MKEQLVEQRTAGGEAQQVDGDITTAVIPSMADGAPWVPSLGDGSGQTVSLLAWRL